MAATAAASMAPSDMTDQPQQPLYTCISCLVGFHSPLDQRTHYRSDLHRYNMKRQVAGLPPVRQDIFEQKVQQRQTQGETSGDVAANEAAESSRSRCQECNKSFASANAYTSHLNSRKHKETVAKMTASSSASTSKAGASARPQGVTISQQDPFVFRVPAAAVSALSDKPTPPQAVEEVARQLPNTVTPAANSADPTISQLNASDVATTTPADTDEAMQPATLSSKLPAGTSLTLAADATDAEVEEAIAARLSSTKRIDPSKQCIFCQQGNFADLEASLAHMQRSHGFFIPEQSYITDKQGLAQYLADKVSVGHLCLYCNGRGRGFNTAEAARKHMLDKSHCKVAYDREEDQLELSDFYDFSSSYPDYVAGEDSEGGSADAEGADWEDMDEDGSAASGDDDDEVEDEDEAYTAPNGLRYGDSELELVLPSGARLGHRSLARYYRQTLFSTPASVPSATGSGGAVARRLIDQGRARQPGADLIVRDRQGGEVRARNRGEAREAKRHIREFRDTNRREQYKTQIGYRNNNQKHFRDPLLQ